MSIRSFRGRPRKLKKSGSERAATAAGGLRVRVVEHESLADQIRVVVENRPVQIQQALLVDVNLRALRALEDFVAQPRLLVPGERVAQPGTAAALDAYAKSALVDALPGHQRPDLLRGHLGNLYHSNPRPRAPSLSGRGLRGLLRRLAVDSLLLLVIRNRRLDRVLGQHRAVDLDGRQAQLVDDVGVLDRQRLVDGLALQPFRREARARNRRPATERL